MYCPSSTRPQVAASGLDFPTSLWQDPEQWPSTRHDRRRQPTAGDAIGVASRCGRQAVGRVDGVNHGGPLMRSVNLGVVGAATALAATLGTAHAGANSRCDQGQGLRTVRGQHRPCRFFQPGRRRQLVGTRRRRLPRRGGRAVRRRRGGQVHAADLEGTVHGAAVRRGRRPVAQHHLDARPRQLARPRLHRRDLLRRPGLHGAQGARREERARARRRLGLRADGHDHRAQPRRLFPGQQHVVYAGRLSSARKRPTRPTSRGAATR